MSNIDKRALRKAAIHAKTVDDWGCDADNFHERTTPDTVLALLDELEAKDRRTAEQADIIAKQEKWIKGTEAAMITATDRAEAAEKRIAELEAREVKLPDRKCDRFWSGDGFEFDNLGYQLAVESAIKSSDIKVIVSSDKGE